MDELIERLRAATGPDRELDGDISVAVNGGEIVWKQTRYTMEPYPARKYASKDHIGGFGFAPVEAVTASIDAALTLVPEGAAWIVLADYELPGRAHINCSDLPPHNFDADAASPAIALCIAALEARKKNEEAAREAARVELTEQAQKLGMGY